MFSFINKLSIQGEQLRCNPTQECQQISSVLGVSHIAIGLLSFIFALGFYLLFFNKDEKETLEKYSISNNTTFSNNQKNAKSNADNNLIRSDKYDLNLKNDQNPQNDSGKFSLLLRPLDDNEKKVLIAIREQEGITQSTLRFRADLSKAKISQILTDFEKKKLIERKAKGKTYSVFLAENF